MPDWKGLHPEISCHYWYICSQLWFRAKVFFLYGFSVLWSRNWGTFNVSILSDVTFFIGLSLRTPKKKTSNLSNEQLLIHILCKGDELALSWERDTDLLSCSRLRFHFAIMRQKLQCKFELVAVSVCIRNCMSPNVCIQSSYDRKACVTNLLINNGRQKMDPLYIDSHRREVAEQSNAETNFSLVFV